MYDFHYNFMIRKFNTRLLFTDTVSLCYECDEDPREKMYKYKELFDLINFPVSCKYYCSNNKKVLGKMKDEYGRKSILRFVGLKSKMYSILDENNNEKITSKGHNAFIEFQEFYDTLFKKKIFRRTMRRIGSKNYNLGTDETNKISLSCFDDKRYILKNGINTLAYGHKDIKMINLDSITNENNKKHNEKWPYIPDHPYRILIIGGSGSGKTNTLLNLIKEQDYHDVIDKIYLYAKDLSEPKYEYLIEKREDAGIKNVSNPNTFIECSNTLDDVYEDIDN